MRTAFCVYGAGALAVLMSLYVLHPKPQQIRTYCALAIPPVQVVKSPQLEAVRCKGIVDGQCLADFGWIVLSDPVQCD